MPLLGTRGAASARGFGFFGGRADIGAPYWMGTYGPQASTSLQTEGVAVDADGNLYSAGYGSNSFGCYLTKYNASGVIQWQRRLSSGNLNEYFFSIALDASNNVYVGGVTDIGGGNKCLLLAKYNSAGTLQWQRKNSGSTFGDRIRSVTVDSSGNIYLAGETIPNTQYAIVSKYDSTLALAWGRRVGYGGETTFFNGVAVDGSGNVYATGFVSGTLTGAIVTKYNSSGTRQWTKVLASSNGLGISVTAAGNIYVAANAGNGMLFKYNTSGTLQWQRLLSNSTHESVALDSLENVYVCGVGSSSPTRLVIAKYNSSGTIQWQRTITNAGNMSGRTAAVDRSDNLYIGGRVFPDAGSFAYGFFAKLPNGGTKTGTYSIGGSSFTYSASSYTASTPTFTESSDSLGNTSGGASFATTTLTDSTPTITSSVTTI